MRNSNSNGEFVFQSGFYLIELTGKKARNLKEFQKVIEQIGDESIFYHMYHSLLEHHFAIPEYYNDFAFWLQHQLKEDVLAEKFASVSIYEAGDAKVLRSRLLDLIKEGIAKSKRSRKLPESRAFQFVMARWVVLPTRFRARNLQEFKECLERISLSTLFYHFFESRFHFTKKEEKYVDDFSIWLFDSLGEKKLADALNSLDPYGYTLEGIRKEIIKLIEGGGSAAEA